MTRTAGHVYTIGLGLIGWAAVIALPLFGVESTRLDALAIGMFVVVILATRSLAFKPTSGTVLSLDSVYLVAATLCVGAVGAGRLVAVALTVDALVRLFYARRQGRVEPEGWFAELAYVLYFGGMSGGLLATCAWVLGADRLVDRHDSVRVLLAVSTIAAALLVIHYALQGLRARLLGGSWRTYLRELALPSIAAEATLMPIGVVLVLLYDPEQPLGFMLLSLTYLLINFVFGRLARARKQLEARVHDLEILNSSGRKLSAALQLEELVEAIAHETCAAIPEAEAVSLVHRRAGGERGFVVDGFDRATERFFRQPMVEGEGAAGWVMKHTVTRMIDDLTLVGDVEADGSEHGIRAWLGAPLLMYGGCEGVIAVQSSQPGAFREDHKQLLESVGMQIAAALQNAHLYELAMVDGLTGLFMRRYFDARIDEEIERSKRFGTSFAVVMIDVDNFKQLNDTHGHLIGDRVLRAISNTVKQQMRGVDTAARYGGEEIAIILPRTDKLGAYNVGERIRGAIVDLRITTDDDSQKVLSVTASFGIAAYPEIRAANGEDLLKRADQALYRAKKMGKNRVELYWSEDSQPVRVLREPS